MINNQSLLLEITQRIATGGSLGAMLPDITNATLRGSHADGIRVVLGSPSAPLTYASGQAAAKMIALDPVVAELVKARGILELADTSTASDAEFGALCAASAASLGALIALPLTAQQTYYGVLWLAYEEPHTFTPDERLFLSIVAGQTAVAIANAYAFETARRGREQLAAILSSSADPILVIDTDELILLLNPSAERALGVQASAAIGKPMGEVIHAEPLVELLRSHSDSMESVEWQNETGQTFAPGMSDVSGESGQPAGRVLVLRDITRYKTLRDNQAEFVSTVSHDLRSPLTYMHGYATMLPMVGDLNDKQKGFADKIVGGITQMSDLVEKILDAGRLDPEGNYQLNRETCDVAAVVTEVVGAHMQPAEKKSLHLSSVVDPGVPILNLDKLMLSRALNNLVDNAIKYTPEHGEIAVIARITGNALVLRVQDNGLGISEENQKHLFERFKRVRRREHQAVKGSGLGLFIVKNVAQKHGGDAWVESKEGAGSTFSIRIPLEGANLLTADGRKS